MNNVRLPALPVNFSTSATDAGQPNTPPFGGSEARQEALARFVGAFQRELYLPDPRPLFAVLGTVAANLIECEPPVWLVLVGPPSSGKSEILRYVSHLPHVHVTSEVSAPGLLSCTPAKERAKAATGGLLPKIGRFGILVVSDLSTTLNMRSDAAAHFFSLMRDVFDGRVERDLGQDGGMSRLWEGKVGLIAASTGAIDRHHAVINSLGDRYLYFRMPKTDVRQKMARAKDRPRESASLRQGCTDLFRLVGGAHAPVIDDVTENRLMTIAEFVARARTAVIRDGYRRDVLDYPEPEEPVRLYKTLRTLLRGLEMIGLGREAASAIVEKVALDSLPPVRLALLRIIAGRPDPVDSNCLIEEVGTLDPPFSEPTVRRALEEMKHYRLIETTGCNGTLQSHSVAGWTKARLPAFGSFSEIPPTSLEGRESSVPTEVGGNSEKVGARRV